MLGFELNGAYRCSIGSNRQRQLMAMLSVTDGHSECFGRDGYTITSAAAHEKLSIANASNRQEFLEHLKLHEKHKTSHVEMSMGLANSGIEKWTVDTNMMTITFYDKAGNEVLIEPIK